MLLTIFSASNYGGVCRNRGGVLIFDEKGPAEVKEFYAPPLDEHRRSVASESQAAPGARLRRDAARQMMHGVERRGGEPCSKR